MTSIRLPALFLITSTLTLTAPWMFPAQAAEPVAAVQDWPMWSGPTANWLATPDEKGLLADLNQAKLLWTSEDKACGGSRISLPENCRSAYRDFYSSRNDQNYLGYRLVIRKATAKVKK